MQVSPIMRCTYYTRQKPTQTPRLITVPGYPDQKTCVPNDPWFAGNEPPPSKVSCHTGAMLEHDHFTIVEILK